MKFNLIEFFLSNAYFNSMTKNVSEVSRLIKKANYEPEVIKLIYKNGQLVGRNDVRLNNEKRLCM